MGSLFGGGDDGMEQATRQAAAQAAETARQIEAGRQASIKAQNEMEANFAADLKGENKATVVAGGTAEALGVGDDAQRKKRQQGGLSSTLGVNI